MRNSNAKKDPLLTVGVQGGGVGQSERMAPIHVTLNRLFRESMIGDYFDGIDGMGFLFRVSGEIQNFGSEGLERLFHRKKHRSIEIDVVFPEAVWRDLPEPELWKKTECWLREGMARMVARGVKDGVVTDEDALEHDFEKAMVAFAAERPGAS